MKNVLHGLKLYVNQRLDDDDRFCEILKARKDRIIGNLFNEWMFQYELRIKKKQNKKMAHDFRKARYVKWVMNIWLRKLEKKLKKRHME